MKKIYTAAVVLMAAGAMYGADHAVLSPRTAMALSTAQAQSRGEQQALSAYITVDPVKVDATDLRDMGIDVSIDLGATLTARLTLSQLEALAAVDGVEYIQISTPVEQMLDVATAEVGADRVHAGQGIGRPYTGRGVVVGIVDKGFDYTHPAFYSPDGQLRISRVWEQASVPSDGQLPPAGYNYGIEMTSADEIADMGGDVRGNSHGTHVTSIAAGSDTYLDGSLLGMAPEAEIVLVSMLDDGGGNVTISDGIAYIFGYADSVDKPCVINLSLGAHYGPHDGTSPFDAIADALQGPGRLIVGAAGNHRTGNFHVRRAFDGADSAPLRTFIDYKTSLSERNAGGQIDIWAQPDTDMEVSLLVVRTASGDVAERVTVYPAADSGVTEVTLGRNVTGRYDVVSEVSPLNGKPHVLLTSQVTALRAGYSIAIEVTPHTPGAVDIWGDNIKTGLTSKNMAGYTGPTDESTICEIGGTAHRILTVGAYTSRADFVKLGETDAVKTGESDGALSSFSSGGPTADGRMKPQVSAPGCMISAAVSNYDNSGTLLYSQYYKAPDGRDCFYGYMQGTSMSSPMVAGIVATWLEAWPDMTPEELVEVVKATARTDQHTGVLSSGDNDWGYGKIDALAGIKECIRRNGTGAIDSPVADTAAPARLLSVSDGTATLLFTAAGDIATADVYSIDGTLVSRTSIGAVTQAQTATVTIPQAGAYIITVTVDGTPTSLKVMN